MWFCALFVCGGVFQVEEGSDSVVFGYDLNNSEVSVSMMFRSGFIAVVSIFE